MSNHLCVTDEVLRTVERELQKLPLPIGRNAFVYMITVRRFILRDMLRLYFTSNVPIAKEMAIEQLDMALGLYAATTGVSLSDYMSHGTFVCHLHEALKLGQLMLVQVQSDNE
jgi:hypothetical protein